MVLVVVCVVHICTTGNYVENIEWLTLNNRVLWTRMERFANDFTDDTVTSENHWRIASLFHFLHVITCFEYANTIKTNIWDCPLSPGSFRHCRQGRPIIPRLRHYDIIFTDCSYTSWYHLVPICVCQNNGWWWRHNGGSASLSCGVTVASLNTPSLVVMAEWN